MQGTDYNPWPRGIAWLLLLGPLFFLSYNYSNGVAAAQQVSTSLYWPWERQIPFLPWTIVPYWSIDLFYGLSFLACGSARATDRHGLRLLTAQLISVAAFLLWPLRFAFERPAVEGPLGAMFGAMFGALGQFDLPYNQAPSLHIALLVLIWAQLGSLRVAPVWTLLRHVWALLVAVSVLTTWQHHLIDVPTGAAVGLLCLWLWPDLAIRSPLRRELAPAYARAARWRLALIYLAGALAAAALAWSAGFSVAQLLLGWVALALALVAWNYAWCGGVGFQLDRAGRQSLAASWLLAPYTLGARVSARLWTWGRRTPVQVAPDVWLGPLPQGAELSYPPDDVPVFRTLCTLSAELAAPRTLARPDGTPLTVVPRPWLDLVPASGQELLNAAHEIDHLRRDGPLLVACALGVSRSAAVLAVWLHLSGRAASTDDAVDQLRALRPQLVLNAGWHAALQAAENLLHTGATMPAPLHSLPMSLQHGARH